jgi:4-amino-4-deoxy-L-arabinose transferase-like glycosyltransferase
VTRAQRLLCGAVMLATYVFGIVDPLIDEDQAWYAEIAGEMMRHPLEITHRGEAWLDKPHFQFWPSMAAFEALGRNAFAAQFPALVFALLALVYTYLFGRRLYDERTGFASALILGTSLHFVYSETDLRAEVPLAGLIAMALFHLYRFVKERAHAGHLFAGSLALSAAFMTKGLFAVLPVATAVLFIVLTDKRWGRALCAAAVFVVGCSPSTWAYAHQFGAEGVRFFLWDSQVGRFFNSGPIRGRGHPGFFLHTVLWAFIPWSLAWYGSLVSAWKERTGPQLLLVAGVVPTFVLMNLSKFQLPHYIVMLFPLMAVQAAPWLLALRSPLLLRAHVVMGFTLALLAGVIAVLAGNHLYVSMAVCLAMLAALFTMKRNALLTPALGMLAFCFVMNASAVPRLLDMQCATLIVREIEARHLDSAQVRTLDWHSHGLDFALQRTLRASRADDPSPGLVATRRAGPWPNDNAGWTRLSVHPALNLTTWARDLFGGSNIRTSADACELWRRD